MGSNRKKFNITIAILGKWAVYLYSSLSPLRARNHDSWKINSYRKSNRDQRSYEYIYKTDQKIKQKDKERNFCYHKVGKSTVKSAMGHSWEKHIFFEFVNNENILLLKLKRYCILR